MILESYPPAYSSVNDNLIWVVYDANSTTKTGYKYVGELFIGGVKVYTSKVFPRPDNSRGVFSFGTIIREYVSATFNPASGIHAQELGQGLFVIDVILKVREEYEGTLNAVVLSDLPRTFFNHYNGRSSVDLSPFIGKALSSRPYLNTATLNGSRSFIPVLSSGAVAVEVKTYNDAGIISTQTASYSPAVVTNPVTLNYTVSGDDIADVNLYVSINGQPDAVQVFSNAVGTFVANENDIITVKLNANGVTYPWPAGSYAFLKIQEDGIVIFYQEVTSHANIDEILASAQLAVKDKVYQITVTGGNGTPPGIAPVNTTSTSVNTSYSQQLFDVSPVAINGTFPGAISDTVKYYTVKLGASVYRFDLVCEPLYYEYSIHFLNQLGGMETMPFRKVSRKTYDIEKKTWQQLPYRVSSSGVVSISSNGVMHDQKSTLASRFKEKLKINTDLLTDEEYKWLSQLVVSPMVYLQDGATIYPVTITNTNYEFKEWITDKLTNLTLEVEFGTEYKTQFR